MIKNDENKSEMLDGCNCLNCRLSRIEEQLNQMQRIMESVANSQKASSTALKKSKKKKKS